MIILFFILIGFSAWIASKILMPFGMFLLSLPIALKTKNRVEPDGINLNLSSDLYTFGCALVFCYLLGDMLAYFTTQFSDGKSFRWLYYLIGLSASAYATTELTDPSLQDSVSVRRHNWQTWVCISGFIIGSILRVF